MALPNTRQCAGCGAPIVPPDCVVGVGTVEPQYLSRAITRRPDGMAAFAVCHACHRDPARRKIALKVHFFTWPQLDHALRAAGASSLG